MTTTHTTPAPAIPIAASPGATLAAVPFTGLPAGVGCASCRSLWAENGELRRRVEELERVVCRLLHELDGD